MKVFLWNPKDFLGSNLGLGSHCSNLAGCQLSGCSLFTGTQVILNWLLIGVGRLLPSSGLVLLLPANHRSLVGKQLAAEVQDGRNCKREGFP